MIPTCSTFSGPLVAFILALHAPCQPSDLLRFPITESKTVNHLRSQWIGQRMSYVTWVQEQLYDSYGREQELRELLSDLSFRYDCWRALELAAWTDYWWPKQRLERMQQLRLLIGDLNYLLGQMPEVDR